MSTSNSSISDEEQFLDPDEYSPFGLSEIRRQERLCMDLIWKWRERRNKLDLRPGARFLRHNTIMYPLFNEKMLYYCECLVKLCQSADEIAKEKFQPPEK